MSIIYCIQKQSFKRLLKQNVDNLGFLFHGIPVHLKFKYVDVWKQIPQGSSQRRALCFQKKTCVYKWKHW